MKLDIKLILVEFREGLFFEKGDFFNGRCADISNRFAIDQLVELVFI